MVFRDPALAYAMVALGALIPDLLDLTYGGLGPGHSIVVGGTLLAAVMLATRGRRRLRRRLLGVPLGFMFHLVLDAAWAAAPATLWWPLGGWAAGARLPSLTRPLPLLMGLELIGVALGVAAARGIGSARQARRDSRQGQPPDG